MYYAFSQLCNLHCNLRGFFPPPSTPTFTPGYRTARNKTKLARVETSTKITKLFL
jgi:hypothetical protein